MKSYRTEQIRNVGLFSHGGAGKTSLTEALLFGSKTISRLGRVDDGNTVSDFDPDEVKRHISVSTSVAPCEWNDTKLNLIDVPGYADFIGEMKSAMRVVDSALILIDSTGGVEVGTELVWGFAGERELPRMLFINKLDRENGNFFNALEDAQKFFGANVAALQIPIGKESGFQGIVDLISQKAYIYAGGREGKFEVKDIPADLKDKAAELREKLVERIVESDEELMMRYLDGEVIGEEELRANLPGAVKTQQLYPVLCGSATANIGVIQLLDFLAQAAPPPLEDGKICDPETPFSAIVFKTTADPFVGKLTYFKVVSGALKGDGQVFNATHNKSERVGQLYLMRGKEQLPTQTVVAGDIGAVAKLQETVTNDTLSTADHPVQLKPITFPAPLYRASIVAKTKSDLEKIGTALHRLVEEDPTLHVERDPATGETILSGMGESHVQVAAERLQRKFGVGVTVELPKVPYRETIMGASKAEYKHKKQTGGHGQYGHVLLEVMHVENTDFEFTESVVGGVVPRNYIPAVEKGVREALSEGILAGFPVINVRVNLYDGSYHPVDSSEMAFKIAANQAFKKGAQAAKPVLLEPVMDMKITVPDASMGDVMGDINSQRRGRVLGMEQTGTGFTTVEAQAPLAEVQRYATDLRSMTQGRGLFTMSFSHYEPVPQPVAEQIIAKAHKEQEAAAH